MCELHVYFAIEGDGDVVMDSRILSIDPVYKECIHDLDQPHGWTSVNYEGMSSFKDASGSDCDNNLPEPTI